MKVGLLAAGAGFLTAAFFTVVQPAWENMETNATTCPHDGVSLSDCTASVQSPSI